MSGRAAPALAAVLILLACSLPAPAQEPPAAPEADETIDPDRFEWGVALVEGYFDAVGTFGYRRSLRRGGPFDQSLGLELAVAKQGYLGEGALSVAYLLRPLKFYRESWSVRPLLEFGPAAHAVVQVAEIDGFDDTAFHARAFLKGHAYAGVEAMLGRRWGLLVRGRLTTPSDRPLDYAQAAIFLR